jgi:hypothetical protein
MLNRFILGVCFALLMSSIGCSSDKRLKVYPVEGTVLLDGQPLANALVVLHPVAPKNTDHKPSSAQTDASGKFKATTYISNDGVPDGEYAVTVAAYELKPEGSGFVPGGNILAPELASPTSTNIKVQVASSPTVLQPINVQRSSIQQASAVAPAQSYGE